MEVVFPGCGEIGDRFEEAYGLQTGFECNLKKDCIEVTLRKNFRKYTFCKVKEGGLYSLFILPINSSINNIVIYRGYMLVYLDKEGNVAKVPHNSPAGGPWRKEEIYSIEAVACPFDCKRRNDSLSE